MYNDSWDGIRFGDLIDEFSDRTKDEDEDVLLSAAIEGMFLNTELFGHQRGASNKGYKKIGYGTLVLSTQNLHLGNANVNLRFEHGMVSPAYKTYRIKNCSIKLLAEWIKSEKAKQFFYDATTVGASVCRRNVEWETLYNQFLYLPSDNEQKHIADFLSLISEKIHKQELLIENLKKYKRGVSMRFFDEILNDQTCAAKQFSEIFELIQNNTFSRECLTDESTDVLNVHYGDILVKYGSVLDPDIDAVPFIKSETDVSKFSGSSYLQDGDVIFADTAEDYTVGKMCEIINVSNRKILSGLHTMPFRPTIAFTPMYLGYYLNSSAFRAQILPIIQGVKVSSISKSEMKKTIIYIPSIDRQKEIVSILNALDNRIKRNELIMAELKEMKKGLLQNLFI